MHESPPLVVGSEIREIENQDRREPLAEKAGGSRFLEGFAGRAMLSSFDEAAHCDRGDLQKSIIDLTIHNPEGDAGRCGSMSNEGRVHPGQAAQKTAKG